MCSRTLQTKESQQVGQTAHLRPERRMSQTIRVQPEVGLLSLGLRAAQEASDRGAASQRATTMLITLLSSRPTCWKPWTFPKRNLIRSVAIAAIRRVPQLRVWLQRLDRSSVVMTAHLKLQPRVAHLEARLDSRWLKGASVRPSWVASTVTISTTSQRLMRASKCKLWRLLREWGWRASLKSLPIRARRKRSQLPLQSNHPTRLRTWLIYWACLEKVMHLLRPKSQRTCSVWTLIFQTSCPRFLPLRWHVSKKKVKADRLPSKPIQKVSHRAALVQRTQVIEAKSELQAPVELKKNWSSLALKKVPARKLFLLLLITWVSLMAPILPSHIHSQWANFQIAPWRLLPCKAKTSIIVLVSMIALLRIAPIISRLAIRTYLFPAMSR